jgi:hypothetical protein
MKSTHTPGEHGEDRKRYQIWRHATTFSNYVTIAVDGIQIGASNGQAGRKAIWLHRPDKTAWAILHTMERHGVNLDSIIVLELHLERDKVKHHGHGLWYITEAISPSAIRGVLRGTEVARHTSVEGSGG